MDHEKTGILSDTSTSTASGWTPLRLYGLGEWLFTPKTETADNLETDLDLGD
jgi:hypothetical protein